MHDSKNTNCHLPHPLHIPGSHLHREASLVDNTPGAIKLTLVPLIIGYFNWKDTVTFDEFHCVMYCEYNVCNFSVCYSLLLCQVFRCAVYIQFVS